MGWRDILKFAPKSIASSMTTSRDDAPHPAMATIAIGDLLSVGKGMWFHHNMDREAEGYDATIGFALAQRYSEEPPILLQGIATASALIVHCNPIAAITFVKKMQDYGYDMGVSVSEGGQLLGRNGASVITAMMDIYGIGEQCAERQDMEINWAPFQGPARVLWDAGFKGIASNHPAVAEARFHYVQRVNSCWV